jgi:hypothetical protein
MNKSLLKELLGVGLRISSFSSRLIRSKLTSIQQVFGCRNYSGHKNRLADVVARFKNHTIRLFERREINNIGYWFLTDQLNTLVYVALNLGSEQAKKLGSISKKSRMIGSKTSFNDKWFDCDKSTIRLYETNQIFSN